MKESSYLGQARKHGKWPLSLRSCSRCSQRPRPAPVHSPFYCNLAQIPTVRAAFLCRRSFSCGRSCFTLSARVAEKDLSTHPTMGTALITHSVQAASPFLSQVPTHLLGFPGITYEKTKTTTYSSLNHSRPGEWNTLVGPARILPSLCNLDLGQTPPKTHGTRLVEIFQKRSWGKLPK